MRAMFRRLLLQHAVVCLLLVSSVTPALAQRGRRTAADGPPVAPMGFRCDGAAERGPHRVGRRRAGRSVHLLRRRRVRRHLEDDRRRHDVGRRSSTTSRCRRSARSRSRRPIRASVWAGTGEAWAIRRATSMGDGIYKSTDAGETWTNMGLAKPAASAAIIVHPTNPDIVYACALGRVTGPQQERGVFHTTDGGQTWKRVLFVDAEHRLLGLSMDAKNPRHPVRRHVAGEMQPVGESAAGRAAASTCPATAARRGRRSKHGMPRVAAREDRRRDRAVGLEADVRADPDRRIRDRSGDRTTAATNWHVVSWDRALIGRAGYYIRLAVAPENADEVFVLNSCFQRSTDGGQTVPDQRRLRRQPRHLVRSEGRRSLRDHRRRRRWRSRPTTARTTERAPADRADVPRRRRQPRAVLDLQQPPGRRHDARAEHDPGAGKRPTVPARLRTVPRAGRAGAAAEVAAVAAAARRTAWDPNLGGCESGFTHAAVPTTRTSSGRRATATRSRATTR